MEGPESLTGASSNSAESPAEREARLMREEIKGKNLYNVMQQIFVGTSYISTEEQISLVLDEVRERAKRGFDGDSDQIEYYVDQIRKTRIEAVLKHNPNAPMKQHKDKYEKFLEDVLAMAQPAS